MTSHAGRYNNHGSLCRDGLQKMFDVYTQNEKLGDPKTLEGQLAQNAKELDALNETIRKYEVRAVKCLCLK